MRVAVAISDVTLEREVIQQIRRDGHELVKRCLDDRDVDQVPSGVTLYADEYFHARFPRSVLVTSSVHGQTISTKTVALTGPNGGMGISTVALNLAVALKATLIDASAHPSISSMTGQGSGTWFDCELRLPPIPSLGVLLPAIATSNTVIDLGQELRGEFDSLFVVVSAHPIAVERYLLNQDEYGDHSVLLNKMASDPIGVTAKKMLERGAPNLMVLPRDDRACVDAFVAAKPLREVAPKSPLVRAISALASNA